MKEFIFRIEITRADELSDKLSEESITDYYFDYSGTEVLLKYYTESDIPPDCLSNELLVNLSDVDKNSWERAWGENYTGHELTDDIFILPEGIEPPVKLYRTIIKIDPFDSFGDGHHPTTRLCGELLEYVVKNYKNDDTKNKMSMLDIGTGSGILAIAAWSMGIRDIELFDYDQVSVMKASENLKLNGITALTPFTGDIYNFKSYRKYDIVTANLLSKLIEDNLSNITSLLNPEGFIIFSGISVIWAEQMKKLFEENNLRILKKKTLEEWCGFLVKHQTV